MERIHGNAGVSAVHPALSSFSTSIHPGDQPCQCAAGTMRMLYAVNGGCSLYASGRKFPLIGPRMAFLTGPLSYQLTEVSPAVLEELCQWYRLDTEPELMLRNLLEVILPVIAGELRLSKEWTYKDIYTGMLEATAKLLRVPKYQIYTVEALRERVLEKYREEETSLPAFSRLILNE